MATKVLNAVLVAVGVLVLAVLALIVVYVIGYSLVAIFGHAGMGASGTRGIGAGIAAIFAIVVLALYFRSRRATTSSAHSPHARGKHVA